MREAITMKMNFLQLRAQSDTPALSPQPPQQPPQFARRFLARQPRQAGFTLIESLVAIIILSLTVVSVFPPIFWATATRVQNRRAEQAIQLAQSEIDRVRVAVERKAVTPSQLPPKVGTALKPDAPAPTSIAAGKLRSIVPGCNTDDGNQAVNVGDVILVDTDPEPAGSTTPCAPEFMIQTFRGTGVPTDDAVTFPEGFVMGVRVYSITARKSVLAGTAQKGPGTLRGSTGLGTQQIKPLATQYTTIVRTNKSDGLGIYRQLCAAAQGCEEAPK
jgi:prepilin-type N-terminal cleavage/methylation domain-containing protein